ncbi:MAG: DUF2934 domain-containing protein [Nitrospirota bacterium]|nr:DUF2934 domain-containing protein [Nitrospirota bacterium]
MTAIQTTTRTTGSKPLRQPQQSRENEGKGHMQDNSEAARGAASGSPIELPEGMWERIATKARELWELRGRREGHDFQDWFDAEIVVMEEIHEARECG